MTRCSWTETCTFFTDEVGYSIDLQAAMRAQYCLGDNTSCARLHSIDVLPLNRIPDDLIPTDHERLAELVKAYEREVCERCHREQPGCCDE